MDFNCAPPEVMPTSWYERQAPEALRDFFSANNARELEIAIQTFASIFCFMPDVAKVKAIPANELEYTFNRLFVGPMALSAPPYSSVYLDAEGLLMSKTTLTVRKVLQEAGLSFVQENILPDDHIAVELDAFLGVSFILGQLKANETLPLEQKQELIAVYCSTQIWLVEHLQKWLPLFTAKILENIESSCPMQVVSKGLLFWLKEIQGRFGCA